MRHAISLTEGVSKRAFLQNYRFSLFDITGKYTLQAAKWYIYIIHVLFLVIEKSDFKFQISGKKGLYLKRPFWYWLSCKRPFWYWLICDENKCSLELNHEKLVILVKYQDRLKKNMHVTKHCAVLLYHSMLI